MLDYGFKIKVSDLLQNPGKKDEIIFEKKFTKLIEGINENGISGKIIIQGLDNKTIFVELNNISLCINDFCDICGNGFKRNIIINNYSSKFFLKEINGNSLEIEDFFQINTKDETIDIENMIIQSIILEEPIIKKCDNCLIKNL